MNRRTLISIDKLQAYISVLKARLSVWLTEHTHALADLTAAQAEQPDERADAREAAPKNERADAPEAALEAEQADERTDEQTDDSETFEANRAYIDSLTEDVCSRIALRVEDYKPPVITPPFGALTREEILRESNFSMDECPW